MDNFGVWSEPVTTILTINGIPEAEILDITPTSALEGDEVSFQGKGTDDGTVERYIWTSDLDGELHNDTTSGFSTTTLSNGTHEISFKVQDDQGVWSDEEETIITINGQPRAKILELSPNPGVEGDKISFEGEATDDGTIQRHVWISDLDGELWNDSTPISWSTPLSDLSNGSHTISFWVKDDQGVWSEEATASLFINGRPRAKLVTAPEGAVLLGKELDFEGMGTDDGTIDLYIWRSDQDGVLYYGPDPSFKCSNLTIDIHEISFRVRDDRGALSNWTSFSLIVHERPEAVIDHISRDQANVTDTIQLEGSWSDDGYITTASWWSSLDGLLGSMKQTPFFLTTDDRLSEEAGDEGTHIVWADYDMYPGVKANRREVEVGTWSTEAFTEDTLLGKEILGRAQHIVHRFI